VSGFRPDSIVLLFSDRISKRVPVLPLADFTLKRQFDTLSGPVTVPDSVTLSGPPSVIRKVRMVRTQPVKLGELQYSIDSAVALQPVALAETSPSKVRLRIPVEKFTEGIQEVAVSAVNVPSGFQLKMFPEKVKVRYQVSLSSYASVTSDQFEVVVDAGRAPVTEGNLLPLRIVSHPASIRSMSVEPAEVEFIFRKK
jgi:YbbR domain-containing protein